MLVFVRPTQQTWLTDAIIEELRQLKALLDGGIYDVNEYSRDKAVVYSMSDVPVRRLSWNSLRTGKGKRYVKPHHCADTMR